MITTAARIPACTTPGHTAPSTRTIRGTRIVVAGLALVVLLGACASNPTAPLSIPADSAAIVDEPAAPQAGIR